MESVSKKEKAIQIHLLILWDKCEKNVAETREVALWKLYKRLLKENYQQWRYRIGSNIEL